MNAALRHGWDPWFNDPSEERPGELRGHASEVSYPEFDLIRPNLTSVT